LKLPIDTNAFAAINCSLPPTQVLDRQTKQPKADANGEPLYSCELVAYGEEGAEILPVKFPGTPPAGMKQGMPVKVTGLVASDWSIEDRHGLSFRAARIELLNAQAPKGGAA
jgi:hypothetical protein